jgi:pseudouridine synthase
MTSGLLICTTDGDAAHRLTHPKFAVERTYWLRVHGRPATQIRAALMSRPVVEGRPVVVRDARVRPAGPGKKSIEIELTLAEGRHRIVRRLAELLELKVEWLHRVSYGPVRLGKLAEGKWRALTPREIDAIGRIHAPR